MAVRFEGTFGGGADVWLRMQAARDLAKVRTPGRHDASHFRPAVVKVIVDRTTIGARTLIAARQDFADVNKGTVAVTGTAT
jgi:plasmid maintenance system antidote protein VapI